MAHPIHSERHFTGNQIVRDLVLGMADGLTVPFALAAGLTGAIETTWIIVVAGLAEVAAGAIAMGLGGYLAARSEAEHYESERTPTWPRAARPSTTRASARASTTRSARSRRRKWRRSWKCSRATA